MNVFKNEYDHMYDDEEEQSFYEIWSCDPQMKEYKEMVFECDLKNVKPEQYNLSKRSFIIFHL